MSITPKTITPAQLTASAAAYYTAPANTRSIIKKLTFTNTDTSARTVTVYLIPSGGAANDSTILVKAQSIGPSETWECYAAQGQTLQAAGALQALADVTTKVTIQGAIAEVVQ